MSENMKNKKWNWETIIRFLQLYETQPCLWDVKSNLYKDQNARKNSLQCIVQKMKIENFAIPQAKAKIRMIRNVYTLELWKIEKSKRAGRVYRPNLRWFPVAHKILHKVVQIRQNPTTEFENADNILEANSTRNIPESCIINTQLGDTFSVPNEPPDIDKSGLEEKQPNSAEYLLQETNELPNTVDKKIKSNNEFEIFGKLIACQLQKLPEYTALQCMAFIHSHLVKQRLQTMPTSNVTNDSDEIHHFSTPIPGTSTSSGQFETETSPSWVKSQDAVKKATPSALLANKRKESLKSTNCNEQLIPDFQLSESLHSMDADLNFEEVIMKHEPMEDLCETKTCKSKETLISKVQEMCEEIDFNCQSSETLLSNTAIKLENFSDDSVLVVKDY